MFQTIFFLHDLPHLAVATLVCVTGALLSVRLLESRLNGAPGQGLLWSLMFGIVSGGTVWATHFIAMLGYMPGPATGYLPTETKASLFVAMVAGAMGAALLRPHLTAAQQAAAGAVFGLGVAAMHFTGMRGYSAAACMTQDPGITAAAVIAGTAGGGIAFRLAARNGNARTWQPTAAFVAAVVSLHFLAIGGLAFDMLQIRALDPLAIDGNALRSLALFVIGLILVVGLLAFMVDQTWRRTSKAELERATRIDSLTGLHTHIVIKEAVEKLLDRGDRPFGVFLFDLDRFKAINETYGHAIGDMALREMARRLSQAVGPDGLAARMGSDEFGAVVPDLADPAAAEALGRLLIQTISLPMHIQAHTVQLAASCGAIHHPFHAASHAELMSGAGVALDRAKGSGRNQVTLFDHVFAEQRRRQLRLSTDLHYAAERGELEMYLQVQGDVRSGNVIGFEALLRWNHPVFGVIPPGVFIPLAEANDAISSIGCWILNTACVEAATWTRPHSIAVNVSAHQLSQRDFPAVVSDALRISGLPPSRLELEITESSLIRNVARAQSVIADIKSLGVRIAMDDYGTGFSSLSTLKTFPFDKIKIDRSFITEIETDRQAAGIVRATVILAEALGMRLVAEGVETEGHLAFLRAAGCREAQGYLLGRPEPVAEARRRHRLGESMAERFERDRADEGATPETGTVQAGPDQAAQIAGGRG